MTRRDDYTQEKVDKQLDELNKNAPIKGINLKVGVYLIDNRLISLSDMCDRARLALLSIKKKYGCYYAKYNDSMRQTVLFEHQLSDSMEEALENKQFLVYLQPKHYARDGSIAGAEALVRWNHPTLGIILPGKFIPLFEKNGFISKLDYYMLENVVKIIRGWIDKGMNAVPVSVNISRIDFYYNDFADRIEKVVDKYKVPHELIHIEVTESAYTMNSNNIIEAVTKLQKHGFIIEMDDFGSGYSSLNTLSELPVNVLKLDMLFLFKGDGKSKEGKKNILSFIVSLSKWLRLVTVAEGVETKEEYEFLRSIGCSLIQGYYFAQPMPYNDFNNYLANHPTFVFPKKSSYESVLNVPDNNNIREVINFAIRDLHEGNISKAEASLRDLLSTNIK